MKNLQISPVALVGVALLAAGCTTQTDFSHKVLPIVGSTTLVSSQHTPAFAKGGELLKNSPAHRSQEYALPSDVNIQALSELARGWAARTESVSYEQTHRNSVSALVAIRQVAGARNETVYVCIHGLFGESLNWKYVAALLKAENEVWIVDLPGSGLSDCPDPKLVGPDGYSPEALAERVLQALAARLAARPEVSKLVLVGHSLGGMVTLRMFMNDHLCERYQNVLEKVEGVALFAPCDVSIPRATETWTTFMGIDSFKAGLGSALWILQYKIVQSVRESFTSPELASRELAQSGIQTVREREHRESTKAIMRAAIPWRVFARQVDEQRVKQLEAGYAHVTVPCLIVWGESDETLPAEMGYKIMRDVPDARLVVVRDTKHLLPLERPRLCAGLVRQFHAQLGRGELAAARTVQRVDPLSYEQNLLAGSGTAATSL